MIIIIAGGIGSGKTLSAVREIVLRKQRTFTNFLLNKPLNFERLKYEHLFKEDEDKKMKLNFSFWNKECKKMGGFDIFLDEFHNVMNSRRSMSKRNILLGDWLSQIRKILGQAETNNLYLITQKVRRIDVTSRDLCHGAILCSKQKLDIDVPTEVWEKGKLVTKRLPLVLIYRNYFKDTDSLDAYERYGIDTRCRPSDYFIANPFYKYYNSYELISFGGEEYV